MGKNVHSITISILWHITVSVSLWWFTDILFAPIDDSISLPHSPNYSLSMALLAFPLAFAFGLLATLLFGHIPKKYNRKELAYILLLCLVGAFIWGICSSFLAIDTISESYAGRDVIIYDFPLFLYFFVVHFIASLGQVVYLVGVLKKVNYSFGRLMMGICLVPIVVLFGQGIVLGSVLLPYTLLPTVKETYLIPEGFQGCFRIVYNTNKGIEPEFVDDRTAIPIPKDGVAWVNRKFRPRGFTLSTYYFGLKRMDYAYVIVKEDGTKTKEFPLSANPNSYSDNAPVKYNGIQEIPETFAMPKGYFKKFYVFDGLYHLNGDEQQKREAFYEHCLQLDSIAKEDFQKH